MNFLRTFLAVAILVYAGTAEAQIKKPFSAEDLANLKRLYDVEVSPDGRYAAFVIRETDLEADKGRTDIWILDLAAVHKGPMRLTTHPENDSNPRWGGNSQRLFFLSDRGGNNQVWMIEVDGGEAMQITNYPVDVDMFELSADGQMLVFSSLVYPQCEDLQCTATRYHILDEDPETGMVFERLMVRYWDSWRDGRIPRLFALPLDKDGTVQFGLEPLSLMKDLDAAVPVYALMGTETFEVSPDGSRVYFSTKELGPDEPWSVNTDIFTARTDGLGTPENLTAGNKALDDNPELSPDGRYLAWFATKNPDSWSENYVIRLKDLVTGQTRDLAPNWDRTPATMTFSYDGTSILATSDHLGSRALWEVPLDGGEATLLDADGTISNVASTFRGILLAKATLQSPADLYLLKGAQTFRLTQINKDILDGLELGDFEQFTFTGAGGDTVYGYVVKPVQFNETGRYPVAFIIHGGPTGSMGDSWSYRWNPQTYAGAGYGVVFIDFHGSTGYGQAFTNSIHGNRGSITLEDLKSGLRAAKRQFPWLDTDNACALGGSFGGYMVNLIAGVWPDGFKCLVTHDGMFDNRMKYFTSDIIGYLDESFGGMRYYEDIESHEQFNPATLVDNWETPMLVIHGERDFRVPVTHGIAAFTAAQGKGIESRFLMFPNENHWVLRPNNSIQWHREVLGWLDRWTKP